MFLAELYKRKSIKEFIYYFFVPMLFWGLNIIIICIYQIE